jgi:photolyase PhrII
MRPQDLPDTLRERTTALSEGPVDGDFVLYWMHGALRAHENPALDAALAAARHLGLPLFVYRGLSERYPYANDRHHTFLLEGHRDVGRRLRDRRIGTAFHLERPGHRGPHLKILGTRAALVLTEDIPVPPRDGWTRRLAGAIGTPVWTVDAACVVPMPLVDRPHTRAFRFRKAIEEALEARLRLPWSEQPDPDAPFVPDDLPFTPVDLEAASLPELVAACAIDHTVGPVPHTRGGEAVGYARWRAFVEDGGLKRYHRTRNDPVKDGVSRMSPYLHHGMVAATRLAREAADEGGKGAEKFLDELIVWRELSWSFCRHRRQVEHIEVLPDWARQTLRAHRTDPREALLDRETLWRGRTGDALWDACQRSLLQQGELHNNVRMTWGKALLGWTDGPQDALDALIALNHRYALDGRDANSYGGLLWCMGGFDRPFQPEQPVLGTVRPRPTGRHARRLDLDAYVRQVRAPLRADPPRIAVVGAGLAGALCARTLADHGYEVVAFDKGRGAGGRLSTRRSDAGRFDHGAPVFGPLPRPLVRYLDAWLERGLVARWEGPFARLTDDGPAAIDPGPRFVPVPSTNALVKHLLADVEVRFGSRITRLEDTGEAWRLHTEDGEAVTADRVVVAVPAPQAVDLLDPVRPDLARALRQVETAPAWVAMAHLPVALPMAWSMATLDDGPVRMVVRDGRKPGRDPSERLVLHATPDWSRAHLEDDREAVARALWDAITPRLDAPEPDLLQAHRWRFARVTGPLDQDFLLDADARLGVCGDACRPDLSGALSSGAALAGRLMGAFSAEVDPGVPDRVPLPDPPQLALL